ncbi:MAG: hydrogenase [Gemmatimonadetes bacterium RBG_16_66_8]|nr:MAG: hydrogenase [Gemmatimonadetes bacterium RBG_16_66_8]
MTATAWLALGVAFAVAPALPGLAARTRSWLTGRRGAPVLQLYSDLAKLWRKSAVYSATTTWAFRLGGVVLFVTTVLAALLLPFDGRGALIRFAGDFVAFAGLLALGRFALILAAMDTGSSFEGMGASRDATLGSLVEPALFLCFAALAIASGELSLASMLGTTPARLWGPAGPALAMVAVSLFLLALAEAGRVPVDDPTTHLELTMIHEVMVLDHSGPDLALIQYAGALRLALFGTLLAGVTVPLATLPPALAVAAWLVALGGVAVGVGVIEAVMARLRLARVPQFLVAAATLPAFAVILLLSAAA